MTDFLQAVADHLNRTPSMCRCGHPSVLHADGVGCTAWWEYDSGSSVCLCEDDGRAPDMAQWALDHPGGEITDEEAEAMDAYSVEGRDLCSCGHPPIRHVPGAGCLAMASDWTETAFCSCMWEPSKEPGS